MLQNKNGGLDLKSPLFDGLCFKNTILISGSVLAPVILVANTVNKALALAFAFTIVTFFTVLVSSVISRRIVYSIRIILYALIASLVYAPVIIYEHYFFPDTVQELGIMLPLLITNSLIVSKSEQRFFRETKGKMIIDLLAHIIGFDIVIILVGFLREVWGYGTFLGDRIGINTTLPILIYPFGGFILVGLLSALLKKIINIFHN